MICGCPGIILVVRHDHGLRLFRLRFLWRWGRGFRFYYRGIVAIKGVRDISGPGEIKALIFEVEAVDDVIRARYQGDLLWTPGEESYIVVPPAIPVLPSIL
jgi:hypothetical protein